MSNPKILIISSLANSLINFRGDFINHLIREGFEVFCAAPEFENQKTEDILQNMGAKTLTYPLERSGLNPIKDVRSIRALKQIMRTHRIDLVFPYTIKPVIYGSIAARQLGLPVVSLITGLGFTFSGISLKAKALQNLTEILYREGIKKNKVVIFQNIDDQQLFLDKKITTKKQQTTVVDGSGINLSRFAFRTQPKKKKEAIIFIMVTRLIEEKGVGLFLEAAQKLKSLYPWAEFHLVGSPATNSPSGISDTILAELHAKGTIVYHRAQANVVPFLTNADVFVLPSYYREGVPRSILEALSIGMPIITTTMPGCKETVIPEKNGFLIPPREFQPLMDAMDYFISRPETLVPMGKASRELAEHKFDVDIINQRLIDIINKQLVKA